MPRRPRSSDDYERNSSNSFGGRSSARLDYLDDPAALERSTNPIAAVVLAQGQALMTRGDPPRRRALQFQLVKGLVQRGWTRDAIRELLRNIDWLLDLPEELEEAFRADVHAHEQEHVMRYVPSFERLARKEGYAEGRTETLWESISLLLQDKIGPAGQRLSHRVRSVHEGAALQTLLRAAISATTLDEVRAALPKRPKSNGEPK